ncbi:hypothetical protein COY52_01635 [Candidatus Desantisbacteria bacterium CG_4_10_14_0_8_um_filter_48_22]|uniref:Uncharacterized protein n=1 Tax=Candidatus Desantisbacteria bacterium CG_4_10_14_0_8_um_filter_48_22 TaxID=1974543 RepID=A0A2M7SFF4_9BACT|nr:MAG: hypothetical protein AUJ67_03020 [Candidatus Desantisbacteria bacterium CG1_02_49_89]PIZ18023.1 MAG: hypothetical protein COY52_01635 [Candidatus Desantisbacteria bacterium CG_4_10_14_0_8_um_filter_48_22]
MAKISKVLDEIHRIREEIYEEEKGLTTEEVLKKIHSESERIMKKYNLKLRRVENKETVRV